MSCLLITYDLNRPGQNYSGLYDEIKGLGTSWWHHLDSKWLVRTTLTAQQASHRVKARIDDSDTLLVMNVPATRTPAGFPRMPGVDTAEPVNDGRTSRGASP